MGHICKYILSLKKKAQMVGEVGMGACERGSPPAPARDVEERCKLPHRFLGPSSSATLLF